MTDERREELLDGWELAAKGWGRQAERWAEAVAPVTEAMLAAAALAPGRRVLELAAGPGDLSQAAAQLVAPTRVLCSDGVQTMVDVARDLADDAGFENVAFHRLNLESIDLPAGTADVILCRFGVMLVIDPEAALREARRVLAQAGRLVMATHAPAELNPWITTPTAAAVDLGLMVATPPGRPGPFALVDAEALREILGDVGFFDVTVTPVHYGYPHADELDWLGEKVDHSPSFAAMWRELAVEQRGALRTRLRELAEIYRQPDGSLYVPGCALIAVGDA